MTRTHDELARAFADAGPYLREALRAVYELGRKDGRSYANLREPSHLARRRWQRVLEAAAGRNGVTVDQMLARSRQGTVPILALHEAMWLLKHHGQLSFPSVGDVVGRDHSTVIAGVRKVARRILARPELRDELLAAVEGGRGDARVAAVGGGR